MKNFLHFIFDIKILQKFLQVGLLFSILLIFIGNRNLYGQTNEIPDKQEYTDEQNLPSQPADSVIKTETSVRTMMLQPADPKTQIYREGEKRNPQPNAVMPTPGELYKPEKKE